MTTPSAAERALAAALADLGYDPAVDAELAATPARLAELLREFAPAGPPPPADTFPAPAADPVILAELPFHSLCAHHLVPFFGVATVAYLPGSLIAGLGWFPRLLHHLARQPQLQERLGAALADTVAAELGPRGVVVHLSCRQLCMEMRGVRSPGQVHTWARRGADDAVALLTGLVRGA